MFDSSPEKTFAEEDVADLFQQLFSAYSQAVKNAGETTDIYLHVARQNVRLRFAGAHLAQLFGRALLHLQTEVIQDPDFTICVWDTKAANQPLPPFFDQFNQFVNSHPNAGLRAIRGSVPIFTNNTIRTALMGATALTMANVDEKLCVHWILDSADIPYYEVGAPLRVPFNFMFSTDSRQLLHGGAVGSAEGGVFLGGLGGSGKSTTALNCLFSPLSYASDDYVLVDLEDQPTAYSLYNTAKLKTLQDVGRFHGLDAWLANADGVTFNEEKPMFFLNEHVPHKLIHDIPIKAIVFPRFVAGENIRDQPMSQKRAFREIATSTVRQTPGDDQTAISMIGRFVREVACYELIFGEEQADLPHHIAEIISRNS